jgi:lysophospholipase L1-like esterase
MKSLKLICYIIAAISVFIFADFPDPVTVYTIGDSTMADYDTTQNRPMRGWVQMLSQFFSDKLIIKNCAVGGKSTKSFIDLGLWDNVISQVKARDYVFIQFGHNDEYYPDTSRFTDTLIAYPNNLKKFINETRAKNAIPILFTSICYRHYDVEGNFYPSLQSYARAAKKVAAELNVPVIDLNTKTCEMVTGYGMEESKKLYLHILPGVLPIYPDGYDDDTHLSVLGATKVAELAVEGLTEENNELCKYLKTVTGLNKKLQNPRGFSLQQNYPNPFNPNTRILFSTSERDNVTLTIYNNLGQEIKVLINQEIGPGNHEIQLDASDCPSGVYYAQLMSGKHSAFLKMLLMK